MKYITALTTAAILAASISLTATAAVKPLVEPALPESTSLEPLDSTFAEAMGNFSSNTSAKLLSEEKGNTMYSPASLYMALSLAASGAKGETQQEILQLLGLDSGDALLTQSKELFTRLWSDAENSKMKMANSVWLQTGQTLQPQFLKNSSKNFYASIYSVDFSAQETTTAMSQWVADNTGSLLSPSFLPDGTRIAMLINTLYLKDSWSDRFWQTYAEPFFLADGTAVTCPFMHRTGDYETYWKGDGYTASQLGLRNSRMIVVLPDEGVSPGELLSSPKGLSSILAERAHAQNAKIIYSVPKFSFGRTYQLLPMLETLGVQAAFGNEADFTGMLTSSGSAFSAVEQGTHIAIDEEGLEAAAYTAMPMNVSAPPVADTTLVMKLDKPFLFIIESQEGIPLFVGAVADPTDEGLS